MSNPLSTDLRDYVKVYDNVVSVDICQQLIQQFEAQQEKHEVQIHTVGGPGRMVQANFMTDPGWDWANKTLVPTFVKAAHLVTICIPISTKEKRILSRTFKKASRQPAVPL